jgi:hypothetical protein
MEAPKMPDGYSILKAAGWLAAFALGLGVLVGGACTWIMVKP